MKRYSIAGKEIKIPTNPTDAYAEVDDWFILWKKLTKETSKTVVRLIFGFIIWFLLLKYIWLDKAFATYGFEYTVILMGCFLMIVINRGFSNVVKAVKGL